MAWQGCVVQVCQHAFDDVVDSETIYQELNQFVSQAGGNGSIKPTPNSGDGSPYVLNYGSDNPQGDTDWNNFRTALTVYRNLVYFGHGAPNGLGANTNGAVVLSLLRNRISLTYRSRWTEWQTRIPFRFC